MVPLLAVAAGAVVIVAVRRRRVAVAVAAAMLVMGLAVGGLHTASPAQAATAVSPDSSCTAPPPAGGVQGIATSTPKTGSALPWVGGAALVGGGLMLAGLGLRSRRHRASL